MFETAPKILVVDDEPENLKFLCRALRRFNVLSANTASQALALLQKHHFAVIISDIKMPDMSGVDLLAKAIQISPYTIRIIVTAYADLSNTLDAINLSRVSAYLKKPLSVTELLGAVENALELYLLRIKNFDLIRKLEERNRQLEEKERMLMMSLDEKSKKLFQENTKLTDMAFRDELTGVYNYRYFTECADAELDHAKQNHLPLSLVFFDIDHFKEYNDFNGHLQGNTVLSSVGKIIQNGLRKTASETHVAGADFVARYGGEEFVVLLPNTFQQGASVVAERLRNSVEKYSFSGEEKISAGNLTMSAGIATFPRDAETQSDLIEKADRALYYAKSAGRNRVCLYQKRK